MKLLADILREMVPSHHFIGHIGGDDFVIIYDEYVTDDTFVAIIQKFKSEVL